MAHPSVRQSISLSLSMQPCSGEFCDLHEDGQRYPRVPLPGTRMEGVRWGEGAEGLAQELCGDAGYPGQAI